MSRDLACIGKINTHALAAERIYIYIIPALASPCGIYHVFREGGEERDGLVSLADESVELSRKALYFRRHPLYYAFPLPSPSNRLVRVGRKGGGERVGKGHPVTDNKAGEPLRMHHAASLTPTAEVVCLFGHNPPVELEMSLNLCFEVKKDGSHAIVHTLRT